ncbi:hypothetical protein BUALT_Bualt06G0137100 [Buddleja alternifolia]|uniref:Uncharacterized protein n=1 Tax=Buddleja alternifolia TaxID=168488 RepID=A0AAV6XGK7_9LAMI|nr:hypothetical protein BUALT_Bualt06G0137100 [Buddleja alternifolia]
MSMSIFSSFEALCAESSFGQKVGFSWPYSNSNTNKKEPAAVKIDDDLKKGKEVNSSFQPTTTKKKPENRRRPRFAPELDGLHCFETILPY